MATEKGINPCQPVKLMPEGVEKVQKKEEIKEIPYRIPPLELCAVPRGGIVSDPFGSYTGQPWNLAGIPEEMLEMPVQDADDL